VRQSNVGNATVPIPLEKVLSQLARGVVKISFGELRMAAPSVFTPGADRDRVPVSLPLSEVLARLNPALIKRRRVQKQVEVPEEVSSPFDARGDGIIFGGGPNRSEPEPSPVESEEPVEDEDIFAIPTLTRNTIPATPPPAAPPSIPGIPSIGAPPIPISIS